MLGLAKLIHSLFQTGEINGFLGYKEANGQALPFFFTEDQPQGLASLLNSKLVPRYPLEKFLLEICRAHPEAKIGLLARDCDARALTELVKLNQLQPGEVFPIAVPCCPSDLHGCSACSHLDPRSRKGGELGLPEKGVGKFTTLEQLEKLELAERFRRWQEEFAKCIKCYGCRNVCPVYVCRECSLEDEHLIPTGQLPPDLSFHLIRAVHMAGFCIDCGLCEEACPAEIPLRLLYRGANRIVERLFGYKPGAEGESSPFRKTGLANVK